MNTIQDLHFSKKDKKGKGLFNPDDAENKLAGSKLKIKDANTGKNISISDAYKTAGDAYNNYKKAAKNFKKASKGYGAPTHRFKNVEQEKAWTDGENIRKKWGTGLLGRAIAEVNGRVKYGQSYHTADKDVQTKRQEHRDIAKKNYEAMKDGMKQQNKFRKSLYSTREKEIKDIREKVQANANASANKTKRCHSCGSLIPASAIQCPYCTAKVKGRNPNPNPNPKPKPQRPQPKNYDQNAAKQGMANAWKAGNGNEAIRIAQDALKYDWSSDPSYLNYLKTKLAAMKAAMKGNGNNQVFSENFSLPLTNLDEAVKKYKEVSAKSKGIYKPSNETKEERRRRMELAIEKSRVGKPIIVGGIRYYAHSEEQNRRDENDK